MFRALVEHGNLRAGSGSIPTDGPRPPVKFIHNIIASWLGLFRQTGTIWQGRTARRNSDLIATLASDFTQVGDSCTFGENGTAWV